MRLNKMKIQKAVNRDKKIHSKKHGMRVDNRGIHLLEEQIIKKANKAKSKNKKKKYKNRNSEDE